MKDFKFDSRIDFSNIKIAFFQPDSQIKGCNRLKKSAKNFKGWEFCQIVAEILPDSKIKANLNRFESTWRVVMFKLSDFRLGIRKSRSGCGVW